MQADRCGNLDGLFLVRVEKAFYGWYPHKSFLELRFVVLEPKPFESCSFSGRLYCTERALWKLNWFLTDFGYDPELLKRDQVDEIALRNLRGIVRTSHITFNGHSFQNLDAFAPSGEWETISCSSGNSGKAAGGDDGI
jgi:hypothetical protein